MAADLPETLLRQLSAARVRWYAVQAGWKPVEGVKRPVIVLNHPTDDLTQVQIPTAGSDRERVFMMAEVVRQLAEAEKRPPREVLHDLVMPPADVVRLQVESRDAETGSLPLEEGLRLLEAGRDLLLAAACSAHQPQAYYPRQSFTAAQDFLRSCRVGQTERGSFVATILAPAIPDVAPSLFDNGEAPVDPQLEPYERRVTLRLMQALQTVRGALDHGKAEEVLEGVSNGVSANLCEALAAMSPADTRALVHIAIAWSHSRPRIPATLPRRVTFAHFDFPIVREAGRRLREGIEPRRERIEGPVLSLQAEPAQLYQEFQGRVTIRALIADRAARVRFLLGEADFARACEALRDHRWVAVWGLLQRDATAKMYELLHPQRFEVLAAATPTPQPSE
jgi:hypothetical protein